jgi:hypothetical protein
MPDDDLDLGPDLSQDDSDDGDLQGPLPLRKAYRDLRKRVPEIKQAAETSGFERGRAEARRELIAEQTATNLGFSATFGATFLRANPDTEPTPEAVRSFAESLGVKVVEAQVQSQEDQTQGGNAVSEEVVDAAKDFQPTGSQLQAGGKRYTAQEWLGLYQDPATRAEAERAAKEGLVDLKHAVAGSGVFGDIAKR